MSRWLRGLAVFGVVCSLAMTGTARVAVANSVADGGLIAPGVNIACPAGAVPCTGNVIFQLQAPADATGSVVISGGTANIDLFVASADFGDATFENVA